MDKRVLARDLGQILPLDNETLLQMIENALKLPTHSAINDYWLGLLGESPDALDFITRFTSTSTPKKPEPRKVTAPPGSVRRPHVPNAWEQPSVDKPKPHNQPRLSKSVSTTTSQLLAKPKEPVSKQSEKKKKQTRIENLNDVDAILRQLEVSGQDKNSVCNCMARVHPLFEVAPNCLNCGKIICTKEGLRPCSSCGKEIISPEEKQGIIAVLRAEKLELEDSASSKPKEVREKKPSKKITIALGTGTNLWKQQDSLFEKLEKQKTAQLHQEKQQQKEAQEFEEQNKEIQYYEAQKEQDPDLLKAKKNLENLLNFQANGEERTRIIDQASDFELPTGSNLNIWSSGVEKALQLKKQQRQLRKQEKNEMERVGKGKRVLDISLGKDGKAVVREVQVNDLEESEDENDADIHELEQNLKKSKDSKAEDDFKTVWDYEKDSKKWTKPVYKGKSLETDEVPEFVEVGKWERVQLPGTQANDNLEELITTI